MIKNYNTTLLGGQGKWRAHAHGNEWLCGGGGGEEGEMLIFHGGKSLNNA